MCVISSPLVRARLRNSQCTKFHSRAVLHTHKWTYTIRHTQTINYTHTHKEIRVFVKFPQIFINGFLTKIIFLQPFLLRAVRIHGFPLFHLLLPHPPPPWTTYTHTPSSLRFQNIPSRRAKPFRPPTVSYSFIPPASACSVYTVYSWPQNSQNAQAIRQIRPDETFQFVRLPCPSHVSDRPRLVCHTTAAENVFTRNLLDAHKQYTQLREGSCRAYVRNSCKLNFLNRTVRVRTTRRPGGTLVPAAGQRFGRGWGSVLQRQGETES